MLRYNMQANIKENFPKLNIEGQMEENEALDLSKTIKQ